MEWYEIVIIVFAVIFVIGVLAFDIIRKKKGKCSCGCSSKSIKKKNDKETCSCCK